mgnify:FL=1
MTQAVIKGVGAYLPTKRLTNTDLEKMVQTSDAWIRERTGIQERRIAADNELTSDLARQAALEALQDAGLTASDIDLIILATTTPDDTFPATACKVQQQLGMTGGFAFDIQAACSGFLYALSVADAYITQGRVHRVLVIGAETLSRIVDWSDRNTCVLFGDGAGAVVLEGSADKTDSGILSVLLRSDGRYRDLLLSSGGVSRTQTAGFIHMEGREVFRHAVENMAQIAKDVLQQQRLTPADIDYLVPHQANIRIIEATRTKLGLPADKVILTLQQQGNTSAASIPLALHTGIRSGRIQRGDVLLLESMGGGLTWVAGLIRFK